MKNENRLLKSGEKRWLIIHSDRWQCITQSPLRAIITKITHDRDRHVSLCWQIHHSQLSSQLSSPIPSSSQALRLPLFSTKIEFSIANVLIHSLQSFLFCANMHLVVPSWSCTHESWFFWFLSLPSPLVTFFSFLFTRKTQSTVLPSNLVDSLLCEIPGVNRFMLSHRFYSTWVSITGYPHYSTHHHTSHTRTHTTLRPRQWW